MKNLIVKPRPVSLLEGHVYDKETKEPVKGAEIRIMRIGGQELRGTIRTRTYADGFLGATLRQNSRYIVSISVMDYLYYRKNINVKAGQKYLKKNFYLKKGSITKGFSFVANNIYFDIGSAKLKENSYDEIHNIYNFLKRNPKVVIQISGYTDSTGSYEFNLRLSEQRANAIANHLKGKGISRERTHVKGFGYANQAASNLTEEGRKLNRRVEIKVIEVKK